MEAKRVSVIYILRSDDNKYKIGTTNIASKADLLNRKSAIQTGYPYKLEFFQLTTGSYHAERWVKNYFKAKGVKINRRGARGIRGEWFRYHPDMEKLSEIIPSEIKYLEGPVRSDDPHRTCPTCRKSFQILGNHHRYCSQECEIKNEAENIRKMRRIALEEFREEISQC